MKMTKGCLNPNCEHSQRKSKRKKEGEVNKLKKTYKHSDNFCLSCGERLSTVCKICNTNMMSEGENICARCKAMREDNQDKRVKAGVAAVGVVAGLAVLAKDVVKSVVKK